MQDQTGAREFDGGGTAGDCRSQKKGIMSRRFQDEEEHLEHLEAATEEEVRLGYLSGPWCEEQVTQKLGTSDWSIVRRFVLVQGADLKLRPIDDCREAQLNSAYSAAIKLEMQGSDYVSSVALRLASELVRRGAEVPWMGKTLDLSKAYKQLPLYPPHRELAVIYFRDRQGKDRFYISHSLMFGSNAAVYEFNRVSRSLWFLINRCLRIPSAYSYDDFPLFHPEEGAR